MLPVPVRRRSLSHVLFRIFPCVGCGRAGDEFLTGYIASILERDLHWERNSYRLKVDKGVATITLFKDDPGRREAAEKQLRTIDGLQEVAIVVLSLQTEANLER